MNKYVKTLIKKYKNPSIIGKKSTEEVIIYLKQKYIIKDITQNISDNQIKRFKFNVMHSLDGENISPEDIKFQAYRVERSTESMKYYKEMDDDEKIYVYIDEASGCIESNSSGLFTELELYKGISQYDYDKNTDKLIAYLTNLKDWKEYHRDRKNIKLFSFLLKAFAAISLVILVAVINIKGRSKRGEIQ